MSTSWGHLKKSGGYPGSSSGNHDCHHHDKILCQSMQEMLRYFSLNHSGQTRQQTDIVIHRPRMAKNREIHHQVKSIFKTPLHLTVEGKKTPVCHTGMHLSIFSQARCKRTLSCRRRPWQSIVKESPPVRTCHGVTVCKQHQVAHWETECLHTCSLVLKVLICWNLEGCVWKGEAPAWASQIMPWLNVSRTWMLLTGRGLLIESWKHL